MSKQGNSTSRSVSDGYKAFLAKRGLKSNKWDGKRFFRQGAAEKARLKLLLLNDAIETQDDE